MSLRTKTIRLAYARPELRQHLLPLVSRVAMEFPTQDAMKAYLKEHPHADKTKHRVVDDSTRTKNERAKEEADQEGEDLDIETEEFSTEVLRKFLKKHVKNAKKLHAHVTKAPVHVQKFIADSDHRAKVLAKGVEEAKKAPKTLLNRAMGIIKDEVEEKKTGVKAAWKLMKHEEITPKERAALVETVRDISVSVFLSVIAGGGLAHVGGDLAVGFGMGVATRMASDTADRLNDIKDTATAAGALGKGLAKLFKTFLPVLRHVRLGADDDLDEKDAQEMLAAFVAAAVVQRLEDGLTDEDAGDALTAYAKTL